MAWSFKGRNLYTYTPSTKEVIRTADINHNIMTGPGRGVINQAGSSAVWCTGTINMVKDQNVSRVTKKDIGGGWLLVDHATKNDIAKLIDGFGHDFKDFNNCSLIIFPHVNGLSLYKSGGINTDINLKTYTSIGIGTNPDLVFTNYRPVAITNAAPTTTETLDDLRPGLLIPTDTDEVLAYPLNFGFELYKMGEWIDVTNETVRCEPIRDTAKILRILNVLHDMTLPCYDSPVASENLKLYKNGLSTLFSQMKKSLQRAYKNVSNSYDKSYASVTGVLNKVEELNDSIRKINQLV